jgi:MoxR-like ATPase
MNPSTYAGTSPLNEDLRSRFVGQVWDYPKKSHLEKVIDWTHIPTTKVKNPILQLAQDSFNYKVRGDVEYVLTIRDLNQFTELFRIWLKLGISSKRVLSKALEGAIYVKYSDRAERELMIKSAQDTFPAQ